WGAVAGSSHNCRTRWSLTCSWSQADSERNHCSRWTSRCWAPLIGSPPPPLVVDLLVVPSRLREEPLQPLDLAVLGPADRLGPGQPSQGLVAVAGQQQPLQVVTQATALGQAREQGVEPLGVV